MDLSSWLRGNIKKTRKSDSVKRQEEVLGVTDQLIDTVKSFSFHTFKNFPLQDDHGINGGDNSQATSTNIGKDLSEWQERHAMLVLSKVKELSQLRYRLCPGHLKEQQFWRIYFMLVKSYVAEYENSLDTSACEVELAETKQPINGPPPTPSDDN
ncbi:hypothetical protein VitviT2T_010085 [Vitis vinifera]|uniref:BSD domain-containing protein n=1 Tax=Vitis vinifera TaxID=29760 RepID=A0ABY9C6P2_VITVI|eukprot:XP_003632369.1 PREDICTED: uncharacterized protein LOC100854111 [Vitis vinifera]